MGYKILSKSNVGLVFFYLALNFRDLSLQLVFFRRKACTAFLENGNAVYSLLQQVISLAYLFFDDFKLVLNNNQIVLVDIQCRLREQRRIALYIYFILLYPAFQEVYDRVLHKVQLARDGIAVSVRASYRSAAAAAVFTETRHRRAALPAVYQSRKRIFQRQIGLDGSGGPLFKCLLYPIEVAFRDNWRVQTVDIYAVLVFLAVLDNATVGQLLCI